MAKDFDVNNLFEPIYIGKYLIKNRIVMSPMAVSLASRSGEVTKEIIDYYEARARGGVGLIIVEAACVDVPVGRESFTQLNINDLSYVAGLARLAESIKVYSCRAFIQLFHAGRQTHRSKTDGIQPVAPSAIPCKVTKEMPRELTKADIKEIEAKFINAGYYAYLSGFEGVEIHAAHGYLINQFLSSNTNHRTDEYGGNLDNRMRILINIVKGIKDLVPDLAISVRLNIDDFVSGGLRPHEAKKIAVALEQVGADVINCSAGIYESGLNSIEPVSYPEGWRVYLAQAIKSKVNIPVITGGVIRNPKSANDIIKEGKADLVFLGRPLLADPNWVNKVRTGKIDDIRPCIMCNNCIKSNFLDHSISCTVNPFLGREGQEVESISQRNFKVAIIGGGPAGLYGAIALSKIGLKVSLFEKSNCLGGLLNIAKLPPFKERIGILLTYLKHELSKQDVDINLNYEFTAADLDYDYDMLVIATGSRPKPPPFKIKSDICLSIEEALNRSITRANVVIVGGGRSGCEVADFFLNSKNHISIVEEKNILAQDMEKKNRRDLINRLDAGNVRKLTNCKVKEIVDKNVVITSSAGEESIKADYVILAVGYQSESRLYQELSKVHPNVHIIGDAYEVRDIRHAILQGQKLAMWAYQYIKKRY